MMRQTKATVATWGVAGALIAGLLMFGCARQAGHKGESEHGGDAHHEGSMDDGEHTDKSGHGHDDSGLAETMHAPEPTGILSGDVRVIELKARKSGSEVDDDRPNRQPPGT